MNVTPTTYPANLPDPVKTAARLGLLAVVMVALWSLLLRLSQRGDRTREVYEAFDNLIAAIASVLFS